MSPGGHGDHAEREVHRALHLTTPNMEGPDVRALQEEGNDRFKEFHLPGRFTVDGEFGTQSRKRSNRILELLGADPIGDGPAGPVFTKEEQRLVRNPDSRTKEQKERSKRRVEDAQAAAQQYDNGAKRAVEWFLDQKGTTEQPLGSNWGGKVEEWIRFAGFTSPVFWCGCVCAVAAIREGGAACPRYAMNHNEVMLNYANNGQAGLERVSLTEARAGDVVSFNFAHIGMLVEPISGGRLHTIEGNTSATGQANNGGGVYEHTDRTAGLVLGIVRPAYS